MGPAFRAALVSVIAAVPTAEGSSAPDFVAEVRPILEASCVRCHGAGKDKGGLRLHLAEAMKAGGDSGPAVVPGDPGGSELIVRIKLPHEDEDFMPQEADPLPDDAISTLERWVAAGAVWPEGVRLQPSLRADDPEEALEAMLPATLPDSPAASARQVDRLIAEANAKAGTAPIPRAGPIEDLAFLRRATIDLVGRIPTLDEITAFRDADPATRRADLVDRLIEDPRFVDRWTIFFADMLRVRSGAPAGDRLLAFVHQSVESGKPYDELVRELIAANGRPSRNPAVGFLLADDVDPMALAGATSQIFLGVRLACAECHDHPFDDWNQRQFYELAAFFGKTRKVENDFAGTVYTTDDETMRVRWPPEREKPTTREPVDPLFPFRLASFEESETPAHIVRLRERRSPGSGSGAPGPAGGSASAPPPSLDALLDTASLGAALDGGAGDGGVPDVLGEARRESAALEAEEGIDRSSALRSRLADLVTDPRNPFFARAFVNRVWFELVGRGFVEPLDNFSSYRETAHPATLEFLARDFVAGGYDLGRLVRTIVLTDTYRRGHGNPALPELERDRAERAFAISPRRRMLSEVLFDSILVAGHLFDRKWAPGDNVRQVTRQVRVPIVDDNEEPTPPPGQPSRSPGSGPTMTAIERRSAEGGAMPSGYDLEAGIELDFDRALEGAAGEARELASMKAMADRRLDEARRMAEERARLAAAPRRYRLETIEETVDDNPVFTSTMRMATPAPPAHFLRVFGQPGREGLGEFRDHSPSLRQELMMLNGRATHEASRVGTLEPIRSLLEGDTRDLAAAVDRAYLETLTRAPSPDERDEAIGVLEAAASPVEGMADLRWALLNSHEFRYLP